MDSVSWFLLGNIYCILMFLFLREILNFIHKEIKKQVLSHIVSITKGDIITVNDSQINKKIPRKIKNITGTIDSILLTFDKEKVV